MNTSPEFEATLTDSQGNSTTIGPLNISVIIGLAPINVPVNTTLGGNVTVSFSGNHLEVYDNIGKAVVSSETFTSTDSVQVDLPAGQANSVTVVLPNSASASLPKALFVQGATGATNNQVTVQGGTGANTFTVAGSTITADNLATQISNVQKVVLAGRGSSNYFMLTSSSAPLSVVTAGSSNTLDFRHASGGVNVNLNLDKGQAQSIGPLGTTLAITGVVNYLVGTSYADTLIGGPAAVTEIRGGAGNNAITGGSGNNIILGGGGNDTISGGPNKNLIITCGGNSNIYVKGSGNTVFSGTTNYDSNDAALLSLMEQGPSFMFSYSFRLALLAAAANPALKSQMLTYQDTGDRDTIFGSNVNNCFVMGKYCKVQG